MTVQIHSDTQLFDLQQRDVSRNQVRLGIIGCGYVTVMSHLPASRLADEIEITALVDLRGDLAREVGSRYQVSFCTEDYEEIVDQVDAVIVAVPHQYHTPVACYFLERGIHVLVEKPMAITAAECEQMITAAHQSQTKLAVGHMRRFYDSNQLVKRFVETEFLGPVIRFEAEEAVIFDAFKASPFTVLPPAGGVLLDTGPHVLDMLLWWLGDFKTLHYRDDMVTGVEANARLEVVTGNGISGTIELSRTRYLDNAIRLYCEQGTIEVKTLNPTQVFIDSPQYSGPICAAKMVDLADVRQLTPFFTRQLSNFAQAILFDQALLVSGQEGIRSVKVIEQCKRSRQPFGLMPWEELNNEILRRLDS